MVYLNFKLKNSMKIKLLIVALSVVVTTELANAQQAGIKASADTLQYATGVYLGQWLGSNGIKITNYDLLKKGMSDATTGKFLIKDSLLKICLMQQIQKNQLLVASSQEQQMFDMLKKQKGIGFMPSGLAYLPDSTGKGVKPTAKDSIEMEIKGYLPSGQLFEDTYQRKQTVKISMANLIAGLHEGLQMMPEGSRWRFFVPAVLAYGNKGIQGTIPPNSAVIFEVELKKVFTKS